MGRSSKCLCDLGKENRRQGEEPSIDFGCRQRTWTFLGGDLLENRRKVGFVTGCRRLSGVLRVLQGSQLKFTGWIFCSNGSMERNHDTSEPAGQEEQRRISPRAWWRGSRVYPCSAANSREVEPVDRRCMSQKDQIYVPCVLV